jgi:2-beta-glucuronyltransferase
MARHLDDATVKALILSAHDFRTKRKVNLHFIAAALAKSFDVTFYSVGYSWISRVLGRDPRINMGIEPNRMQLHEGVQCYLDKRVVHAGGLSGRLAPFVSNALFEYHLRSTPKLLKNLVADSDIIFLESGFACVYLDFIYGVNPSARIVYIASDDLDTIGCPPFPKMMLHKNLHRLGTVAIPSRKMAPAFRDSAAVFFVPHGLDPASYPDSPSPFGGGLNAVSVGSMLFDHTFFDVASRAFPEIIFHVIGSGSRLITSERNVVVYPEMAHKDVVAFMRHADLGIAPYRNAKTPYYLSDTSMKLMQHDYLGLRSVCPSFAADPSKPLRFSYEPGNSDSIVEAIKRALTSPPVMQATRFLNWDEVALRLVDPSAYPDTAVSLHLEAV